MAARPLLLTPARNRLAVLAIEHDDDVANGLETTVAGQPIELGRLRIDGSVPQLWIDGRQVSVPPMEFLLLRYFAGHIGEVISRAELLDAVWGNEAHANSNTLTVHILRLRKRLGDDEGEPQWIKAIRGLGYQLSVPAGAGGTNTVPAGSGGTNTVPVNPPQDARPEPS